MSSMNFMANVNNELCNLQTIANVYQQPDLSHPSSSYIQQTNSGFKTNADYPSPVTLSCGRGKYNARGKRKQRKKFFSLKTPSNGKMGMGDCSSFSSYPGCQDTPNANSYIDFASGSDQQPLVNNNTLDQILSYKKMLLLQSPEVVEFLKKCSEQK